MVEGSVTRTTGVMNERETMEAFTWGARKACSAAREMAREFDDPEWAETAKMLESMCANGNALAMMRSMTRQETVEAMGLKTGQKFIL